jgi:hypothetical protein
MRCMLPPTNNNIMTFNKAMEERSEARKLARGMKHKENLALKAKQLERDN